jgi:hypothetical protein
MFDRRRDSEVSRPPRQARTRRLCFFHFVFFAVQSRAHRMGRQANRAVYPLSMRLLSLTLSGTLLLQGVVGQAQNGGGQQSTGRESRGPSTPAVPPNNFAIPRNRLKCLNSDFRRGEVSLSVRNPEADRWGDITVAQPKIWQFERVSALLDGLLRDVEGVSLGDLTQLDPSQQNGAALRFVQSALEVGVQYDQAAAVNASNALSSYNALHSSQIQQLDQYNNYMQTLTSERDRLAAQYSAASNEVNALQALAAAGTISDAQAKQLADAVSRQSTTQASLASVNSLISGAGAAPTLSPPPTVTGTSVQGPASGSSMASSLSGFSDVLKSLPQGVQNNLSSALQSPSYPATKRLDNFITLLYERLAREISVLQDDLTRDPENVPFLVQFDVGLYPSKKAKNHVARVEFNLDCPGCKVYSLYPGQSSYNLANYSGSSKRNSFWGNVLTLIGLGISASYRRQTDALQGSLVQSVYTAGFQNGVLDDPTPRSSPRQQVPANQAEQSFGWYYGAAPFEQQVTPGIRSTFALITVPRKLVENTEDNFGNTDACMPFHIDAGWASRNDPMAQDGYISGAGEVGKAISKPFYWPTRDKLFDPKANASPQGENPPYNPSVLTMQTSVKLPASFDDYPLIARREKKTHVLRMEYNTIIEPSDQLATAAVVQTTVQTSTQSTNPTTGQTATQTATQTTGTAVAVSSGANSGSTSPPSANLDLLPCPKGKCAALVIKLDRPIDPNLIITVRGQPLSRVRDWRGRATSVLPPAQSGSDLAAATSLNTKQLQSTRSLLEADQFAPNTWFPLNSTELLINVSVNVATDEEFPVIQLGDPSGSVIIPHDLRRGFTELIINGFHFKPQTENSVQREVARQNWREDSQFGQPLPSDSPITVGPYAFSTFLPLFSPEPAPRRFFVGVGETGDDLLIGFLPNRDPQERGSVRDAWLEAQTQVVLEDRDLDFAWSLSCDSQGTFLACHMPRQELSRVYRNFLAACPSSGSFGQCPGLGPDRQSLIRSLQLTNPQAAPPSNSQPAPPLSGPSPAGTNPADQSMVSQPESEDIAWEQDGARLLNTAWHEWTNTSPEQDGTHQGQQEKHKKTKSAEPMAESGTDNLHPDTPEQPSAPDALSSFFASNKDLKSFLQAYVTTMQVWIWQSDEEGKNVFYSQEPTRINFLPLSGDYWSDTFFKPWTFGGATSKDITLQECNYLPNVSQCHIGVSLLGVRSWPDWIQQSKIKGVGDWAQLDSGGVKDPNPKCGHFTIPTAALANDPVVFSMAFPSPENTPKTLDNCANVNLSQSIQGIRTTIAIPRSRIGPNFSRSEIQIISTLEPLPSNVPPHPAEKGKPPEKSQPETKVWRVEIPVANTACGDDLQLPPTLVRSKPDEYTKIDWHWRNGKDEISCPPQSTNDWTEADRSGSIRLYMEIPRTAVNALPDSVNVVRTSGRVKWVVATLPNLRELLLPSRLTLDPISPTQFALLGKNAGVIDAVTLQNTTDGSGTPYPAAQGFDSAIVILPASNPSGSSADTSGGGNAASNSSLSIVVDTSNDTTGHVQMTTQNSATPAKPAAGNTPASSTDSAAKTSKSLAAGSYAVIPLIQVGTTPAADNLATLQADAKKADAAVASATKKAQAAETAVANATKKAQAAEVALKKAPKDANAQAAVATANKDVATAEAQETSANKDLSAAQSQAASADAKAKAAEAKPLYLPLNVTDQKGKPLIFTIAETKKQTATTPQTTSTPAVTCVSPCTALPCTAACPTVSNQGTATKSQ